MANVWRVDQRNFNGDFLWARLRDKDGNPQKYWDTVREMSPGDIVVHYYRQQVMAVSEAMSPPFPSQRVPYSEGLYGELEDGTEVELKTERFAPKDRIRWDDIPKDVRLEALQDDDEGPFREDGFVYRGYLFPVGQELWRWLVRNSEPISAFSSSKTEVSLDRPTEAAPTDIEVKALGRVEQSPLRRRLLRGRSRADCGLCGEVVPARYLNAAHIKQRAHATDDERRDDNIAMLACLFGCDQAFECGDIRVTEGGTIELGNPGNPFFNRVFGSLVGTTAPAYNETNAAYFEARNASVSKPEG